MTSFSQHIADAMQTWFSEDMADRVVLNGSPVCAHIGGCLRDEDPDKVEQFIDVEFQRDDYPAIDYQSDRLEAAGATWRWPRLVRGDAWTVTVRFVRDQRHRMRD